MAIQNGGSKVSYLFLTVSKIEKDREADNYNLISKFLKNNLDLPSLENKYWFLRSKEIGIPYIKSMNTWSGIKDKWTELNQTDIITSLLALF